MTALETYLIALREIHSTGAAVPETSYYGVLESLLNEVGAALKPKVRCVLNPANRGAGIPDGGLFTAEQYQRETLVPLPGQLPARGVVEVKPVGDDAWLTADGPQVTRYWGRYGQVLVTNYRDFLVVGNDAEGRPAKLEHYRLAADAARFWQAASHPRATASRHAARFEDYLRRVMLYAVPLDSPQDVAWFLASHAREALARVEEHDLPALAALREALEQALGLTFEGGKGEHFFRSTLVQTLFYGVFSAWVLWSKQHPPTDRTARFDWRAAGWTLHVPMIRALYEQVAAPSKLGPLGLAEVLDWTAGVLSRIDRPSFFAAFDEGQAVQYFYEPFLQAFDPALRKELGVWYTPPEIVKYQVERVDTVLREELGVADGLADPSVYVLDPCCGTGAYLVEVLRRIETTLRSRGGDGLVALDVKRAAMERVFGFELIPAPFVVAHLQLGLLLQQLGAPLAEERDERVGVFLTNALTGWEPPDEAKRQLAFAFPELQAERDAAERVKRQVPILVVLGNPPYNAYAGVSPAEELGLVEPYKEGLVTEWGIRKFNLDDLYVRFFRLAERRIAEQTGRGVVCFISNNSWVAGPSFVAMRQHLLRSFDRIWIDEMHGDRKISEYAPDGRTSETVFAIPGFSVGIRQGIAISLCARSGGGSEAVVRFRGDVDDARAAARRSHLLRTLASEDFDAQYRTVSPQAWCRHSLRPVDASAAYRSWPPIDHLCASPPFCGLLEKRRGAFVDTDRAALERRIGQYFDPAVEWEDVRGVGGGLYTDAARFDARAARRKALQAGRYRPDAVRRMMLVALDLRWCYYTSVRPLWNEPRPEYTAQCWLGNATLVTRRRGIADPEGVPFCFTRVVGDDHAFLKNAYYIPLRLRTTTRRPPRTEQGVLFEEEDRDEVTANLSPAARTYLSSIGVANPDSDAESAGLVWMHTLAIGYSPAYLAENADGIRHDWPRVPLPATLDRLQRSAGLGRRLADLLDPDTPVRGITSGNLRADIRVLGPICRTGDDPLDLSITANWGYPGREGVVMPAKGRAVQRAYTAAEEEAITAGAAALGLDAETALHHLGPNMLDVYLNDHAYWSGIPANVWGYHIGGYQVIKKWLSYRDLSVLGRELTPEEAREVSHVARRIAAILLLEPELDANYRAVVADTYAWPGA
ncbi:MAG: N-6 DNA methylase [Armatimonadetes bacterium]|nr:N-6 DNA methylase [Armatimonadota bacterium]